MLGLLEDDPVKSIWDEVDQVLAAPPHSRAEHDAAERRLDQVSPPRPDELGPGNSGPRDVQLPSVWDDVDALLASPPAPVPTRTTITSGQPGAGAAAASGAFSPLEQSVIGRSAPVQMAETPTFVPPAPPAPPLLEPHIGAAPPPPPASPAPVSRPQLTPNPPVNARGELIPEAARGTVPVLDAPVVGLPQMGRGAKATVEALFTPPSQRGEPDRRPPDALAASGEMQPTPLPLGAKRGVSDVLEGGFKTLQPVMAAGAVTNPIGTAATVVAAMAASKGAETAVTAAGGSEDDARLAGNVAAAAAGGAVGTEAVSRFARRQVGRMAEDARAVRAQADRTAPLAGEARGGEPQEPVPVGRGATPAAAERVVEEPPPATPQKPPPPVPPRSPADVAYETMREKLARGEPTGTPELRTTLEQQQRLETAREAARGSVWDEVDQVLGSPPGGSDAVQEPGAVAGGVQRSAGSGDEGPSADLGPRDVDAVQGPTSPGQEEAGAPAEAGRDQRVPEVKRDYASTQINLPPATASAIQELARKIPAADLADDGREAQPHVTVKFGLHDNDPDAVARAVAGHGPFEVKLGKTSIFPNGESGSGDVVKIDIDSPELHRLNKTIADALPHTDTHPKYVPHATVAYVKAGLGEKYAGDATLEGHTVKVDRIVFSGKNGEQVEIPLGGGSAREPAVGSRVRLYDGREGTVRELVTAGKQGGQGLYRERRRARVEVEGRAGYNYEQFIDLDKLTPVPGATMEASRVEPAEAGAPETSGPPPGPLAPNRAPERPAAAGPGVQAPGRDRTRPPTRRPAEVDREAEALTELVDKARAGGHTGDETRLRAELADRLQLIKDLDHEFEDSGHKPETLLREIAQRGGLSVGAETGLKGELRWLREFQDRTGGTATKPRFSFGQVRGVQNVFREKGGTSVDDMLGLLRQDPRFAHLETPDDLVEEIRAAATAEHAGTAIDRLVKGLGEKWWETIGRAPDVDVLDTGEAQARLPGAEQARQVGQADTTFRAPTQASGDDFAREFLGEGETPIEVEPDLFNDEPGSSGLPRRPFRGAWERLPPEPGARKPAPPVPPKKATEPPPRDLLSPEQESGMPMQRFGKQELPQRPPPPVAPARRFFGQKRVLPVAEIVDAMQKLFNGVPVSVGRFSRANLGIYKHQPESVRVQVAEDLHVIAHEMGHHLDLAIMGGSEAFRRGPIAQELKTVGAATSRPSYSAKQKRHEGAAEYFRRWLTEPEDVAQQAPLYTQAFEQYLTRHPAIGTGLRAIQSEVQRYLQLPATEQARLHLDFEGGGRGILRAASDLAGAAKTPEGRARAVAYLSSQWMDDLAYLRLAEEDLADGRPVDIVRSAYVQARLARGAASKAEGFLQFGVRDDDGQFIGRSFDDAIAPVYDRLEDFALYAAAKRAHGLHRRGKESGFTTTQITDTLARLQSPAFDTALEGLREFHRAKLDYMRQGGMLSSDQVARLVKIEPDYIPYQRVMDAVDSVLSGKKIANRGSPVKRMKGSGRRIVNPLETIVRNTHAEVSAVEQNKAMQALVRLVRTTQGSGRWMEEIPEPQVATRFNLADLEKDIAGVLEEAGVELPDGGTTLDEILDTLVTVFTPQQFARGNTRIVTVLENGKRAWFEVHDEGLYDAITAIGPRGAEQVVRLFFKGARLLRRTAVATLGFLIRNPIKDQLSATVQSRAGYRPGIEWLRGLFAYVGKSEAYQLYLHSGGDQAMLVSTDRDVVRRRLRTLGHGPLRKLVDHTILGPLDGVEALAEAGERASRVGEFMRTIERTDARGRGALMQAGLNARDVTQDFQRAGRQARAWNQYTAFFSARIGGYGRMWEAFEENPTGFTWKALTAIALPSLLLWLVNHQDDEYNELPAWERNYYWHVPIKDVKTWRTTGFVRLPKPFELGQIFGSGTELALEWLFKKDPDFAGRFLDARSAYQLVQSIIPTALLPWVEIAANYDFFRDRAIVDPARQELPAELQYNRWTSETAKGLGRIFGVSPAKIETLIYGYTAGVGQGVLQALDLLLGSKKPAGGAGRWPVVGTLYRPPATSEAESLTEFYTARDALAALKAGVKDWKAMGQDARARQEIEKQRPWLADKAARLPAADKQIADFRTQVNAVFANPKLTPDQKRAALDDLYLEMIDIARQALGKPIIRRPREFKPPAPVPPKQ